MDYTIDFYENIKRKYGEGRERKTEIRNFDNISAVAVAANNEKLYFNKKDAFICTSIGLKKEQNKDDYVFVSECSDLDDFIVFREDGTFMVSKIQQKCFVGPETPIFVKVFNKNDDRTIYNMVYRDGKSGNPYYVKRFAVKGVTYDKNYDIANGNKGSKVVYFSCNPNGEAETIKVFLRPNPKLKKLSFDFKFSELAIKGRSSRGNKLTNHPINRIVVHEEGLSTLSAREIWYDDSVKRLNVAKHGILLGEFSGDDKILQIYSNGEFRLSSFDLSTHFDDDMSMIMKLDYDTVFSVIYKDGETGYLYIKRFMIDADMPVNKRISFVGEHEDTRYVTINMDVCPRLLLSFNDSPSGKQYEDEIVSVDEYIGVKSYKAKGKRLSTKDVREFEFVEPAEPPVKEEEPVEPEDEVVVTESDKVVEQESVKDVSDDDNAMIDDDAVQLTLF